MKKYIIIAIISSSLLLVFLGIRFVPYFFPLESATPTGDIYVEAYAMSAPSVWSRIMDVVMQLKEIAALACSVVSIVLAIKNKKKNNAVEA